MSSTIIAIVYIVIASATALWYAFNELMLSAIDCFMAVLFGLMWPISIPVAIIGRREDNKAN